MKNRLIKISILIVETVLLYVILNFNIGCFFKNYFGIRCVSCGLTRALIDIFNFDIVSAFKYNILSVPLFIIILIINILLIYDIISNKNFVWKFILRLSNYYIFILILMFVTIIVNNINKI